MKQLTLIFIVLLLAISFAYADGYPAEEAEHWERVRQLDQLAERFKAGTGFTGSIIKDHDEYKMRSIRGKFPDISFPDLADTLAMRQSCDAVLEKILPYVGFEGMTLTKTHIGYNKSSLRTYYTQLVSGYSFEWSRGLDISYDADSGKVNIVNGILTKDISPVHINYSLAQAVEIARQHYISVFGYPDTLSFTNPKRDDPPVIGKIIYETIKYVGTKYVYDKGNYRLCHIFGISVPYGIAGYRVAYIDAHTGEVYKIYDDSIEFTNCSVQGEVYNIESNPTTSYENMPNIRVVNPPSSTYYTDQEGACTIVDDIVNPGILSCMFSRDNADPNVIDYQFTLYADSTHVRHSDRRDLTLNQIDLYYDDDDSYSPNVYYHLLAQHNGLLRFAPTFKPDTLTVISGCENTGNAFGQYWPGYNKIRIKKEKGKYSHIIRHELSHAYVYKTLGRHLGNDDTHTVEEALADYLACSISDTPCMEYGETSSISSIANVHLNQVLTNGVPGFAEDYFTYDRKYSYPISSAIWEIRETLGLHNNDYYNIDDLLDETLIDIQEDHDSYSNGQSACPRYLFNSLMSRAGESAKSCQLNPTQEVIRDGFLSRGLYFLPSVTSTNDAYTDSMNVYIPGSVVHAKISNYIQDSPIDVYVVKHQQDRYTGAFSDSVPIQNLPVVLGPIRVDTDMQGVAKLAITGSESLLPGEYDIIADCGYIYPDSTVYLNFSKRNVLDAIDGMDAPGFIISSWGDVAVALDLSSSMQDYSTHLGKTVKALVQSMIPGERINAFGFTEGTASENWIENGFVDLIGNEYNYFVYKELIDTTAISSLLNSVVIEGNTDLVLPFHHGASRLSHLYGSDNRKSIILLSDGVHFVTPPDEDFPGYPGNWEHTIGFIDTLITSVVVPDSIRCFTICYGNDPIGEYNMRRFATLGNGALYHVEQLGDMKLILNQLLCSIRGTAAVVNSIKGIEPGMVQVHEIMVEPQASELRIVVIGKADSGGGAISYTLISPSGVLFSPVENAGVCEIRNPESGIWIARVTNNTSSASSYSILGDTRSDINLAVSPPPVSHSIEKPLLISASLKNYCTPITNSSVTARLTRDNWLIETPMYDDGNHHDGDSGDGIYANYLYPFAHGYDLVSEPGGICNLEVFADMPSVSARRSHVQQIYIESNNSTSYPINSRLLTRGWNWIGFPRLSDYDGGNTIPYASISLMPYLQQIISENGYANYDESGWHYNNFDYLNSQMGYKLLIHNTDQVPLYDWGAITDTTSVYSLQKDKWNWLTYPCFNAAYPEDALANVIDNIDYIMAQNWSMKKENGIWIRDSFSHRPVIKYGESILIYANEDTDFSWNSSSEPPVIEAPLESHHFVFNSKPEYETLIIESVSLASNKTIKEIGVYQNQECIGARCAEGFPLHILAYSDTVREENFPLEIRALTSDDIEITLKTNEVWDEHGAEEASILNPEILGFRHLSLREGDQIPTVLSMSKNYPNPFNPSTTINYAVPQAGKVKLEIYNLRGQKVKVLVNEQSLPGMYKAVWDGKDRNNRSVSSGIYFAKLEHNNKTKIQKMVLMK